MTTQTEIRAQISRDIWTRLFERTKEGYKQRGYSDDEADDMASREIRNMIRSYDGEAPEKNP